MHDAYCADPAITEFDIYHMCDPATAARNRGNEYVRDPTMKRRMLRWGIVPKTLDQFQVLKLRVEHDDRSIVDLPAVVADFPNLLWLEIPNRFVATLTPGAIPASVTTLRVIGGGKATLPKTLCLPGLRRLEIINSGTLRFQAEEIPDIRQLGLKLDSGQTILKQIDRVENLEALEVGPTADRSVLERLRRHPLRFLKLRQGNLDTVEPLRDCPTLTNIWLLGLNKLTSLEPLIDLPILRELSVTYCTHLQLDRSMLRFPSIQKLLLFANQEIGLTAIRPEIERLGLEHLMISGTR